MTEDRQLKEWLKDRPFVVRRLANRYPPGSMIGDKYVVSYNENGTVGVSSTNPAEDYEQAVDTREYVCPTCVDSLMTTEPTP